MQHIGVSSLEDDIADILASLPKGFPQTQNTYLSPYQQIQANRPAYTYSFQIHPDRLEEDVPPQEFETFITAHTIQIHQKVDKFIPYANYVLGLATFDRESQMISFTD